MPVTTRSQSGRLPKPSKAVTTAAKVMKSSKKAIGNKPAGNRTATRKPSKTTSKAGDKKTGKAKGKPAEKETGETSEPTIDTKSNKQPAVGSSTAAAQNASSEPVTQFHLLHFAKAVERGEVPNGPTTSDGPVIEITSSRQFNATLYSNSFIVVEYCMNRCGPCTAMAPIFKKLAMSHSRTGEVVFVKVNIDKVGKCDDGYGLRAMPTFLVFRNGGSECGRVVGADPAALKAVVQKVVGEALASRDTSSGVVETVKAGTDKV